MQKCFLCDLREPIRDQKNQNLKGFCQNCIDLLQSENHKKTKSTQIKKTLKNIGKLLDSSSKKIESYKNNHKKRFIKDYHDDDISLSTQTSKPIFNSTIPPPRPITVVKSQYVFKGEVRPLNQIEKNDKKDLICPYCNLKINRGLYFYPLVILRCQHGYYHQECFAKLMSEGKHQCLTCKKNFFQLSDDDDDDGDFF